MNKMTFTFSVVTALALGVVGCGDSSGNNGTGGTGGTPTNMAMVRAAHLAPAVPSAEDTAVDILVNGQPSGITLEFGESSGFVELPPGDYIFGIAAAGTTNSVLDIGPVTLLAGDILNAIAFRDEMSEAAVPVNAFGIPGGTNAPAGSGTVYVAHGADDAALDPVDLIDTVPGACPPPILDDFAFGEVTDPLPIPATTLNIGFSVDDACGIAAGPLAAPVTADAVTILVAVDTDISDGLAPAVYALLEGTEGEVPTLAAPKTASIRVAHLAPEVPMMGDTAVDILINDNTAIPDLEFAQATPFIDLPVGDYTFGIAPAGTTEAVFEFDATLIDGQIATVVAYRSVAAGTEDPVGVLLFDGSTENLVGGSGRVLVGHGADDSLLDPVDVINVDDCPPPIADDFVFGTTAGPLDLAAGNVDIAFSLDDNCGIAAGPLRAGVTADVVTILVAVDNDVDDNSLTPAVYALVGDASGSIPTLSPSP
jgi:hypothetical protein